MVFDEAVERSLEWAIIQSNLLFGLAFYLTLKVSESSPEWIKSLTLFKINQKDPPKWLPFFCWEQVNHNGCNTETGYHFVGTQSRKINPTSSLKIKILYSHYEKDGRKWIAIFV